MKTEQGFISEETLAAPDFENQSNSKTVFNSSKADTPLEVSSGISQQTTIVFGCLVSVGAMLTWLFLGLGFVIMLLQGLKLASALADAMPNCILSMISVGHDLRLLLDNYDFSTCPY